MRRQTEVDLMTHTQNGKVPWSKSRRNPERRRLERQGNVMFWVTLAVMLAIVAVAGVYALIS